MGTSGACSSSWHRFPGVLETVVRYTTLKLTQIPGLMSQLGHRRCTLFLEVLKVAWKALVDMMCLLICNYVVSSLVIYNSQSPFFQRCGSERYRVLLFIFGCWDHVVIAFRPLQNSIRSSCYCACHFFLRFVVRCLPLSTYNLDGRSTGLLFWCRVLFWCSAVYCHHPFVHRLRYRSTVSFVNEFHWNCTYSFFATL